MSEARHTRGPWYTDDHDTYISVMSESLQHIGDVRRFNSPIVRLLEAEANADLIAAAPDLLAACETALGIAEIAVENGLCFDHKTNQQILKDHVDLKAIRAAIARAKGGA